MSRPIKILGISAFYHDSAAALLVGDEIVAAAQEERFTRVKHDSAFPENACRYVLAEYGLSVDDLDAVVFYEKPYIRFERLMETYAQQSPFGLRSFLKAMPVWFHGKIFPRSEIRKGLEAVNGGKMTAAPKLLFSEHHLSHAASAYYPSPFDDAAILTVDGVGEWATATIAHGKAGTVKMLREMRFPHSIGLLYSAFTYYCGFKVNSGEYKLMGLAPYGNHNSPQVAQYKQQILENLVRMYDDGSVRLNLDYFDFTRGLTMCVDHRWEQLFGIKRRALTDEDIEQKHMDLALAIQQVLEESMMKLARTARDITGADNLVLAGGVALNCVSNSKLVKANMFSKIWIQPAAGDAGGAIGAAYMGREYFCKDTKQDRVLNSTSNWNPYLGPTFSSVDAVRLAHKYDVPFKEYAEYSDLFKTVTEHINEGQVIGWFQGRMEWGPRALGNRSILADPRDKEMQKKLNLKVKFREGFRPFAPVVREEDVKEYFDWEGASPYMLFVAQVKEGIRKKAKENGALYERLYSPRSTIPAVTHLDYSARLQTVSQEDNPILWELMRTFKERTGCGVLINTSFNVRGEPIVCTPEDAYRCFMISNIDYLVIDRVLFSKVAQPDRVRDLFQDVQYAPD